MQERNDKKAAGDGGFFRGWSRMKGPGQGGEDLGGVVLGMGQNVPGQVDLELP